jgi:hypothetical protein
MPGVLERVDALVARQRCQPVVEGRDRRLAMFPVIER